MAKSGRNAQLVYIFEDLPAEERELLDPARTVMAAKAYVALRRPDVWPPGDLGLHKSMAEMRGLSVVPTSEAAAAFAMRWRPWRAVAARLLWHSYLSRRDKTWDRQPPTPGRQ